MAIGPVAKDIKFLRKTLANLSEEVDQLTMLQDISKQIISNYDFNQIINLFLSIVKELIGYSSCILYLFSEESNSYEVTTFRGMSESDLQNYELDEEVVRWIIREGRWTHISFVDQKMNNSFLSILPLQGAKRDMGFLLMDSDSERNAFTQANMKRLSFIASQTAIALENQNLYSKLDHSREYIKNILESINSGIITIDMSDRITQINKNVTAMLGLPSADIIGFNYQEALPRTLVKMIDKVKEKAMEDGFAFERIFDYYPAKELKIPLGLNSSILLDNQGSRIGIIFVFRNMLALKELERLRQLDELKSEFVSNVSHELRSPLSVITSYVETLLEQVEPDDYQTQREFLIVINNESERLAALVNDLLDISRIESGRFEMDLNPVSLSGILETALREFQGRSHDHCIILNIPSELPDLMADRDKMIQVFINLLDNAIKFSPNGGSITIDSKVQGKMMKCDITDQGIGIAKEDMPRIFDKFYRVDNSDGYMISGTGLGLSIVRHIVKSHGGRISVKSREGKWSKFTLFLPFAEE